jgi:hypothetical protein
MRKRSAVKIERQGAALENSETLHVIKCSKDYTIEKAK